MNNFMSILNAVNLLCLTSHNERAPVEALCLLEVAIVHCKAESTRALAAADHQRPAPLGPLINV